MTALASYQTITTTYLGQKIFTDEHLDIDWDLNPIKITDSELKTMNFNHIISIITNSSCSPSAMAKLKPQQFISPIIAILDNEYFEAIRDYKKKLIFANINDSSTIQEFKMEKTVQKWTLRSALAGGGSGVLVGFTTAGPLGAFVGGIVGGIGIGSTGNHLTKNYVDREGSAFRIKWLSEIDTLEKVRLKTIKNTIHKRCLKLVKDLKELEKHSQADLQLLNEIEQIELIFKSIFPKEPLKVTWEEMDKEGNKEYSININEYINSIKNGIKNNNNDLNI